MARMLETTEFVVAQQVATPRPRDIYRHATWCGGTGNRLQDMRRLGPSPLLMYRIIYRQLLIRNIHGMS
jgi:hypothetical protein